MTECFVCLGRGIIRTLNEEIYAEIRVRGCCPSLVVAYLKWHTSITLKTFDISDQTPSHRDCFLPALKA